MQFSFVTAHTIHFGPGTPTPTGPHAGRLGRRAMVVTGRSTRPMPRAWT
jgi:hypothetical protein